MWAIANTGLAKIIFSKDVAILKISIPIPAASRALSLMQLNHALKCKKNPSI